MQKAMITATTVFALILSAGASIAAPSFGNGQRGIAKHAISTTTQIGNIGKKVDTSKGTTQMVDSSQGTNLPEFEIVEIDENGSRTVIFGMDSDIHADNRAFYGDYSAYLKSLAPR
ncbi:MAG: hypothetical protein AAFX90_13640 [Pseudomonadota bacterium]